MNVQFIEGPTVTIPGRNGLWMGSALPNQPMKLACRSGHTSRAKKVLEFAMSEARELNFEYVGTEHLLLGLLREEKGIAAQVLTDAGLTIEVTRNEIRRLLAGTQVGGFPKTVVSGESDQRFKTAIGLIELHRVRFGSYPNSLDDIQ